MSVPDASISIYTSPVSTSGDGLKPSSQPRLLFENPGAEQPLLHGVLFVV